LNEGLLFFLSKLIVIVYIIIYFFGIGGGGGGGGLEPVLVFLAGGDIIFAPEFSTTLPGLGGLGGDEGG
tara:strand:+ start:1947 stop:2153 length:207 start_codon:yes stop_codon:yes gene_type:complete